jgi:hypothetical protein
MYISLTETLNTTISNDKEEFIELWDFDPIQRSVDNPTWSWKIERKNNRNELIKPIIHPAHYDWQICWRKGKEIYVLNCVKYFKFQEIYWSSFIIICELPNL